jgi:NadR type nicotinamide-nucleotide adenylyltransferase
MIEVGNSRIKNVGIVGPECTGKSDLAAFLANHYSTTWVPEYARGCLDNLVNPYEESDLLTIAQGQLRLEETWLIDANRVLLCDTTLLVIKIWSEYKYGRVNEAILESLKNHTYDLHLLTYIDIPWQNDPQREHPDKRNELYEIYLKEVKTLNTPFLEIRGDHDERRKIAIEAIDALLKNE